MTPISATENTENSPRKVGSFSPVSVKTSLQSPYSKSFQGRNLTGIARCIRDLVADIHAAVQLWNKLHLDGLVCLKYIAQEIQKESYSQDLQERCDDLERLCDKLNNVVETLGNITDQMKTIASLHKSEDKLFSTLPAVDFGNITEDIYIAYRNEAKQKHIILENVAHNRTESIRMLHLAGWVYQTYLSDKTMKQLELLLVETGHRKV